MRVAIIHYWLIGMRGGERVLEQLCDLYPEADIFTHVVDEARISAKIRAHRIKTTFISKLPFARTHYQKYLPLMPRALEQLDLSEYDLIISSEAGPAKGVITRPDAVHVTYCHSPMRYIWDQYHQYLDNGGMGARVMMPLFAPGLRSWDMASASRSDAVIANSAFVQKRILKFWGREATVVYPPVDSTLFQMGQATDEYIWVGQLVSYKRPDLAVDTFNKNGRRLHVIGDGPMLTALKQRAESNIRFTKRASFDDLRAIYATCRGLVFTSEEDFGLIPIEVMAAGRPVLAYGRGGALETVVKDLTGQFFVDRSVAALEEAVERFERWLPTFDAQAGVAHASLFGPEQFRAGIRAVVSAALARKGLQSPGGDVLAEARQSMTA